MGRWANKICSWSARVLCTVALVFLSHAHGPIASGQESYSATEAYEYALPDGSVPTLCIPGRDDVEHGHSGSGHLHGCEACRISASVLIPLPPSIPDEPLYLAVSSTRPLWSAPPFQQLFPFNSRPRAPPTKLVV
jgi:hypothetical protein